MATVPVAKPTVPQPFNKSTASSCSQHPATCPYTVQDFLIYLKSILILSCHLCLDPTSGILPSGFPSHFPSPHDPPNSPRCSSSFLSLPLSHKHFFFCSTKLSQIVSLRFSLNIQDHVSQPYKTRGNLKFCLLQSLRFGQQRGGQTITDQVTAVIPPRRHSGLRKT